MFEARLISGKIFRQIVDSIKDLVTDGNIDCTPEEISIQCMDSSHVSLVAVSLSQSAFDHYRCDRTLSLGFNSNNMSKILKMMGRDDILILKAEDDGDVMTMMFENPKSDTIADFGTLSHVSYARKQNCDKAYACYFECRLFIFAFFSNRA